MCERLAVMNGGRIVEEAADRRARERRAADPYSRQLLKSSEGYDRQAAAALVTYNTGRCRSIGDSAEPAAQASRLARAAPPFGPRVQLQLDSVLEEPSVGRVLLSA